MWAPTAGILQSLTVMQQCVYRMKFGDVCEIKKRLVQQVIDLEQNFINTAVSKWRKRLLACVRIVGHHFKQFYCKQLKNGHLDKLSAKVSEM